MNRLSREACLASRNHDKDMTVLNVITHDARLAAKRVLRTSEPTRRDTWQQEPTFSLK